VRLHKQRRLGGHFLQRQRSGRNHVARCGQRIDPARAQFRELRQRLGCFRGIGIGGGVEIGNNVGVGVGQELRAIGVHAKMLGNQRHPRIFAPAGENISEWLHPGHVDCADLHPIEQFGGRIHAEHIHAVAGQLRDLLDKQLAGIELVQVFFGGNHAQDQRVARLAEGDIGWGG